MYLYIYIIIYLYNNICIFIHIYIHIHVYIYICMYMFAGHQARTRLRRASGFASRALHGGWALQVRVFGLSDKGEV